MLAPRIGMQLFLWILGGVSLGNAAWMLAHGWSWFGLVPGVTDTGPGAGATRCSWA